MHIVEFTVDGLAGRKSAFTQKLNRHVNVFYGPNGSGKTTLLKILDAALDAETKGLQKLPFDRAEVKIYFGNYEAEFTRQIAQNKEQLAPVLRKDEGYAPVSPSLPFLRSFRPEPEVKWVWQSIPPEPEGVRGWKHGYLPISRLYRGLSPLGRLGSQKLSEDELDEAFAVSLQVLWTRYFTDISQSVQKIQENGLANILQAVLFPSGALGPRDHELPTKDAYQRVMNFLGRQPGFLTFAISESEFARRYSENAQLRTVVGPIETVEREIQSATAPRESLENW